MTDLTDRLARLSPAQRALLAERIDQVAPSPPRPHQLVAYVVYEHPEVAAPVALRERLAALLPAHMVPDVLVPLSALPRLPNGKVDRHRLPDPAPPAPTALVPPQNEMEQRLHDVWAAVLGHPTISRDANFFALGGDSLLSIHVVSRARQAGMAMQPDQLFRHQTIAALADAIEGAQEQPARRLPVAYIRPAAWDQGALGEATAALKGAGVADVLPLTPLQKGFLFHLLQQPDASTGFMQALLSFQDGLDLARFQQAWQHVVDREPVLRTALRWEGLDVPVQVVYEHAQPEWRQADLRALDSDEQADRLDAVLAADQAEGIDLQRASVLRFTALQTADTAYHILWSTHHILLDGWSWGLVLKAVLDTYADLKAQRPPKVGPAPAFRRYIAWQATEPLAPARSYWTTLLDGFATPHVLGTPAPPASATQLAFGEVTDVLPNSVQDRLADLAREEGLTPSTVVQAAWALTLAAYTEATDLVYGATVSGRTVPVPQIEAMVGLFINALPIRTALPADTDARTWMQALQQQVGDSSRYAQIPLAQVQAWSAVPGQARLFESVVLFQNYPALDAAAPPGLMIEVKGNGVVTTYPLTLMIQPGLSTRLRLYFDITRFSSADAQGWLDAFLHHLTALLDGVDRPPAELVQPWPSRPQAPAQAPAPGADARPPFAPPRDALELQLTQHWSSLFGLPEVSIDDPFFALGGRSLLAVRFIDAWAQRTGQRLPPALLFAHPTIRALAGRLRTSDAVAWRSLVPIQPHSDGLPLFCIHAGGGHVLFYHDLAQRLAPRHPVYGLEPVGLDGQTPPLERIEDIAAHYLAEIRTIQPHGPYQLMARCASTCIALEMAQQLRQAGEAVAYLGILDSALAAPATEALLPQWATAKGDRPTYHGRGAGRLTGGAWVRHQLKKRHRRLRKRLARIGPAPPPPSPREKALQAVQQALTTANRAYQPAPFDGMVTLLRSQDFAARRDKDYHVEEWAAVAQGGLQTVVLPVHHLTMAEPPEVDVLAQQVAMDLSLEGAGVPIQPRPSA